jgi:dephospho-CoA kinase
MPGWLDIGVTGGIGCGKTTVSDLFAAHGASIIDTDLIAHRISGPGGIAIERLRTEFGPAFITADGALDRARMRELVFADSAAKARLEAILHPMIQQQTKNEAEQADGPYRMFVVPLLIESGHWRSRVDRVLVIDCPPELQIARVMARSNLSKQQVQAIMDSQVTRAQRLAAADDVIDNTGQLSALNERIDQLHQQYLALAAQK